MEVKEKITLVVFSSRLSSGGAEKHLVRLLNALSEKEFDIHLILSRKGGKYENDILPHIKIYHSPFYSESYTLSLLWSGFFLRKILRRLRPDLLFSIQDAPNVVAYCSSLKGRKSIPHVMGVQNNPAFSLQRGIFNYCLKKIIPFIYKKAEAVVSLSDGVTGEFKRWIGPELRVYTIPNIGFPEKISKTIARKGGPLRLLAMARLVPQKNLPLLIDALSLVKLLYPGLAFHCTILGEGKERKRIEHMISHLNLKEVVDMPGFKEHPEEYLACSDIFILSSLYEGFGNVIVEAMAYGLPVISTDSPYGPGEIIKDQYNGILVPVNDASAMAAAIVLLLVNDKVREEMGKMALIRSGDFKAEKIAASYGRLFKETVKHHIQRGGYV